MAAFKAVGYILIKAILGVLVVPIGIVLNETWEWWENSPLLIRIPLGVLYLPAAGIMHTLGAWWAEF